MRLFNFLSRFTFICNIAFLLFVLFRWMELKKTTSGPPDQVVALPLFKDLVIILGVSAIVINALMNIFYLFILMKGRFKNTPVWLPVINFIFLVVQLIYFFY